MTTMGTTRTAFGSMLLGLALLHPAGAVTQEPLRFDFEGGLGGLEPYGADGVSIQDSGDPTHGRVLVLRPNGDVHVLAPETAAWPGVVMEGEVLFPTGEHNYLGILYNARRTGERWDFGNVYIKGNGSYLQVNPHRDYNVSRLLYPEYHVPLEGDAAITVGRWQRFKAEVVGAEARIYVGDMERPQLVFRLLELSGGAAGLQPRSVGGDVWVDNLVMRPLSSFDDATPIVDDPMAYHPEELLTEWQVLGPLTATQDDAGRDPEGTAGWRPFATDARGAVVTGSVVDSHGPRSVAYFRTRATVAEDGYGILHVSTIDALSIWVNGRFQGFYGPGARAWPDFWSNPDHEGLRIPVPFRAGENDIVIRVRGGRYASGGFFARVEESLPTG